MRLVLVAILMLAVTAVCWVLPLVTVTWDDGLAHRTADDRKGALAV